MLTQKVSRTTPGLRISNVETTARALRREIARHNRRALFIGLFSLASAAVLWIVFYGLCCWSLLLLLAAANGPRSTIPNGFGILFTVAAICSLGYAWIDSRLTPSAQPRDDKTPVEIAADFILALPRITLAGWGTLRARLKLSAVERECAAVLLHRLASERRVALHSLPLDIPDEPMRFRILFALQIIEAIELHRDEQTLWIRLNNQGPRELFAA